MHWTAVSVPGPVMETIFYYEYSDSEKTQQKIEAEIKF